MRLRISKGEIQNVLVEIPNSLLLLMPNTSETGELLNYHQEKKGLKGDSG